MFVLMLLPLLLVVFAPFAPTGLPSAAALAWRSSSSSAMNMRVVLIGSAAGVVGFPLLSGCWRIIDFDIRQNLYSVQSSHTYLISAATQVKLSEALQARLFLDITITHFNKILIC